MCDAPSLHHIQHILTIPLSVSSHSLPSLLFAYLNEALFLFHGETAMIIGQAKVQSIRRTEGGGEWHVTAVMGGEEYNKQLHGVGTEIKAITHSNMQVFIQGELVKEDDQRYDDHDTDNSSTDTQQLECTDSSHMSDVPHAKRAKLNGSNMHAADLYVIVDI